MGRQAELGQGFHALGSDSDAERQKAWGYFGDATLRMFGLSVQAISFLRKPKCFVAGTPVHTENGLKPIEEVAVGDRVWAFDRQGQEWRLCPVVQTFRNISAGRLAAVRLSSGEKLTGTDGHAVWVIEGEELDDRGRPDHGADELAGPTPGRWVPLGGLRVGDAVLTRAGVARVAAMESFADPQPVYNLEVDGLHAYAVGTVGLLAHNSNGSIDECHLGKWPTGGKPVPEKQAAPALQQPAAVQPPAKTKPANDAKVVKEKVAPTGGTTEPAKKARHPRGENVHVRAGKPAQRLSPVTDKEIRAAIQPKLDAYEQAKAAVQQVRINKLDVTDPAAFQALKDAQKKAAKEYGEAGAQAFLSKKFPNAQKVHTGQTGSHDLDFVYRDPQTGKYYVVEAKGGTAARNTTNANRGKFDANGDPLPPKNVQQGSKDYLDAQIVYMKSLPDSDPRKAIGVALDSARENNKIVYLEVHAKKLAADGGPSLMVSQWLGPAALQ